MRWLLVSKEGTIGTFGSVDELRAIAKEYIEAGFRGVCEIDTLCICAPRPLVLKDGRVF